MLCQPCTACGPDAVVGMVNRCRSPPDIGVVVKYPAATVVMRLCGFSAALNNIVDHLEQCFMAFGKIGHFRRPEVHRRVNIDGPLAVPGGREAVVPYSL